MRKKMKKNWKKGIIAMMAALFVAMAVAEPVPAQAAAKVTVKVKSPKKGAAVSGSRLTVHTKKPIQLTVKAPVTKTVKQKTGWKLGIKDGQLVQVPVYKKVKKTTSGDVTAKAKYKSSNKRAVSVDKKGKVTIKKAGSAVITVKYNGAAKKLRVAAGSHKWKAHKKTKTVAYNVTVCNCGVILSDLCEVKYCEECMKHCYQPEDGSCICSCKAKQHSINHVRNGEPSNEWLETRYKDVTYVDYYYCDCGAKKAGEPEPKDND